MPTVVLLDTNVWVSAFINPSGAPAQLRHAWHEGRYETVFSLPLLEEIVDVLTRPRIIHKYPITIADIEGLLRLLIERGIFVVPTGSVHECRDPDDDLILETAILGQAQYAVTRDDDIKSDRELVERLKAHGVAVLSVRQFRSKLEEGNL